MSEELLTQILNELKTMNHKIGNLEKGRLGGLEEFRAEVNQKFDEVNDDIDFLKFQVRNNDKELFLIKRKLP
ncbi:MAG: hypothetical protein VR72_11625 [Clostridiaceae bacterium BRH_c20a]|nr:MAG: hypothetical protein VR72_11625 [Clostridiaceae bacterium BRH_c20a]